jgi:hypothetical protein
VLRSDQDAPVPGTRLHGLVGLCDPVERIRGSDLDVEPPLSCQSGKVMGGLLLGLSGEVVAA